MAIANALILSTSKKTKISGFLAFRHDQEKTMAIANALVFLQNQELCENDFFFPPGRKRSLRFAQASLS